MPTETITSLDGVFRELYSEHIRILLDSIAEINYELMFGNKVIRIRPCKHKLRRKAASSEGMCQQSISKLP